MTLEELLALIERAQATLDEAYAGIRLASGTTLDHLHVTIELLQSELDEVRDRALAVGLRSGA